jgi:putative endonuclease
MMRLLGILACEAKVKSLRTILRPRRDERAPHLGVGTLGEKIAAEYLVKRQGYSIVASNVQIALGRGRDGRKLFGEVDIIAYDGNTLTFVEVKTRQSDAVAPPERNVNLRKQRQIARVARRYRQIVKVADQPHRYDVVTVVIGDGAEKVELLRGYFDDRIFQRSRFFRRDFVGD